MRTWGMIARVVVAAGTTAAGCHHGTGESDLSSRVRWTGRCDWPPFTPHDSHPPAGTAPRDARAAADRVEQLREAHCALARRLAADCDSERRILDEGNRNGTFPFPGLDDVRLRLFPRPPQVSG